MKKTPLELAKEDHERLLKEGEVIPFPKNKTRKPNQSPGKVIASSNKALFDKKYGGDATSSDFKRFIQKKAKNTPRSHSSMTDAYESYCYHCNESDVYPHNFPDFTKLIKGHYPDKLYQEDGRTKIKDTTFTFNESLDEGEVIDFRTRMPVNTQQITDKVHPSAKPITPSALHAQAATYQHFGAWYSALKPNSGSTVRHDKAYSDYIKYCNHNGVKPHSQKEFHGMMLDSGINSQRIAGADRYIGVSI